MHMVEAGKHTAEISGKFLYVDCSSGISGDMFIAALVDLAAKCGQVAAPHGAATAACPAGTGEQGGDLPGLLAELQELFRRAGINVTLVLKQLERISGPGLHMDVLWPDGQPLRHLEDLTEIIGRLEAPAPVRERAVRMLERLAQAEAKAHGVDISQVHFHEVGAIDTLVDVFGACWLLDRMGIGEVYSTPLPWFGGFVDCSHGRMALPAPATLDLMRGKPFVMSGAEEELITPTGALLLDGLVSWGGCGHTDCGHEHHHGHQHTHEHQHDHGHGHEHSHEHDHAHSHEHPHSHEHQHCHHGHDHGHSHSHEHGHSHDHGGHAHHHGHAHAGHSHAHHSSHGSGAGLAFPAGARYLDCGVGYGTREPSAASDWPGRGLRLHLFAQPCSGRLAGIHGSGVA